MFALLFVNAYALGLNAALLAAAMAAATLLALGKLGLRERIKHTKRLANPGCHASGFIALVQPLVKAGLIAPDTSLSCFSVTGYSGGGKKMIGEYEAHDRPETFNSPRQYGLSQQHKHLAEMVKLCGLETAPVFCPIVADYYSGMCVTVPLFGKDLRGSVSDITALYREMYCGRIVHYDENADEAGLLAANVMSGRDDMQITALSVRKTMSSLAMSTQISQEVSESMPVLTASTFQHSSTSL